MGNSEVGHQQDNSESKKFLGHDTALYGQIQVIEKPVCFVDAGLPLKILVAEDTGGKVWISYNATAYLLERHHLPADLLPNIAVIEGLAANAGQ